MVVRSLAFMVVRQVLGLIGLASSPDTKDVEIAVLRHQLAVLRREVARLRYTTIAGHAFVQNLRRGHYELGIDAPPAERVAAAVTELTRAI